jgi:hypothetical protein
MTRWKLMGECGEEQRVNVRRRGWVVPEARALSGLLASSGPAAMMMKQLLRP